MAVRRTTFPRGGGGRETTCIVALVDAAFAPKPLLRRWRLLLGLGRLPLLLLLLLGIVGRRPFVECAGTDKSQSLKRHHQGAAEPLLSSSSRAASGAKEGEQQQSAERRAASARVREINREIEERTREHERTLEELRVERAHLLLGSGSSSSSGSSTGSAGKTTSSSSSSLAAVRKGEGENLEQNSEGGAAGGLSDPQDFLLQTLKGAYMAHVQQGGEVRVVRGQKGQQQQTSYSPPKAVATTTPPGPGDEEEGEEKPGTRTEYEDDDFEYPEVCGEGYSRVYDQATCERLRVPGTPHQFRSVTMLSSASTPQQEGTYWGVANLAFKDAMKVLYPCSCGRFVFVGTADMGQVERVAAQVEYLEARYVGEILPNPTLCGGNRGGRKECLLVSTGLGSSDREETAKMEQLLQKISTDAWVATFDATELQLPDAISFFGYTPSRLEAVSASWAKQQMALMDEIDFRPDCADDDHDGPEEEDETQVERRRRLPMGGPTKRRNHAPEAEYSWVFPADGNGKHPAAAAQHPNRTFRPGKEGAGQQQAFFKHAVRIVVIVSFFSGEAGAYDGASPAFSLDLKAQAMKRAVATNETVEVLLSIPTASTDEEVTARVAKGILDGSFPDDDGTTSDAPAGAGHVDTLVLGTSSMRWKSIVEGVYVAAKKLHEHESEGGGGRIFLSFADQISAEHLQGLPVLEKYQEMDSSTGRLLLPCDFKYTYVVNSVAMIQPYLMTYQPLAMAHLAFAQYGHERDRKKWPFLTGNGIFAIFKKILSALQSIVTIFCQDACCQGWCDTNLKSVALQKIKSGNPHEGLAGIGVMVLFNQLGLGDPAQCCIYTCMCKGWGTLCGGAVGGACLWDKASSGQMSAEAKAEVERLATEAPKAYQIYFNPKIDDGFCHSDYEERAANSEASCANACFTRMPECKMYSFGPNFGCRLGTGEGGVCQVVDKKVIASSVASCDHVCTNRDGSWRGARMGDAWYGALGSECIKAEKNGVDVGCSSYLHTESGDTTCYCKQSWDVQVDNTQGHYSCTQYCMWGAGGAVAEGSSCGFVENEVGSSLDQVTDGCDLAPPGGAAVICYCKNAGHGVFELGVKKMGAGACTTNGGLMVTAGATFSTVQRCAHACYDHMPPTKQHGQVVGSQYCSMFSFDHAAADGAQKCRWGFGTYDADGTNWHGGLCIPDASGALASHTYYQFTPVSPKLYFLKSLGEGACSEDYEVGMDAQDNQIVDPHSCRDACISKMPLCTMFSFGPTLKCRLGTGVPSASTTAAAAAGTWKDAVNLGGDGCSTAGSPCAECEGDCDGDEDCQGDLKCFQTETGELPPGCDTTGEVGIYDWCYNPSVQAARDAVDLGGDGCSTAGSPCAECEGDCDGDEDCQGDLKCFETETGELPPGCDTTGKNPVYDFCYQAPHVDVPKNGKCTTDSEAQAHKGNEIFKLMDVFDGACSRGYQPMPSADTPQKCALECYKRQRSPAWSRVTAGGLPTCRRFSFGRILGCRIATGYTTTINWGWFGTSETHHEGKCVITNFGGEHADNLLYELLQF